MPDLKNLFAIPEEACSQSAIVVFAEDSYAEYNWV